MDYSPCRDGLWDGWDKGRHLQEYVASSKDGCESCRFLLEVIKHVRPEWTEITSESSIDYVVTFKNPKQNSIFWPFIGNEMLLSEGGEEIAAYQLYLPVNDDYLGGLSQPRNKSLRLNRFSLGEALGISENSHSDAAFDRMKSWLRFCLSNDEGCKVQNPTFIPHRLLDVRSIDDPNVFLVELKEPVEYVCLSYCWGTDLAGVVTTTTENFSEQFRGISLQSLPQTIQDAIAICRGTDIQYLWVDSLCIIQGDREDWQRESALMLDIYASSTFTIAVSEPDSCKKGFLGPQKYGSNTWQRQINIAVPAVLGGPSDSIYVRTSNSDNELCNIIYPLRSSLEKRGWCLQESILPNRALYFNGKEIVWNCLQRVVCECGHTVDPVSSTHSALKVGLRHGTCSRISLAPFHLYRSWYELVHEFSSRHLTQATDKLVAISGLANLFSRAEHGHSNEVPDASAIGARHYCSRTPSNINEADVTPGDYCVGLWKNRFIQDLSWSVDHWALESSGRHQHTRYTQYCAPTWSWASIDGPVEYLYEPSRTKYEVAMEEHSKLLKVSFTYMNPANHTGPVISGYAVLKGPIMPVLLYKNSKNDPPKSCVVKGKGESCDRVTLDVDIDLIITGESPKVESWHTDRVHRFDFWDTTVELSDTPYYCLKLFSWVDARGPSRPWRSWVDPRMSSRTWFLLLKKRALHLRTLDVFQRLTLGVGNTKFDEFERLGVGTYNIRKVDYFFLDATVKNVILV